MLDLSYFQNSTSNTQIFITEGDWQMWVKPRGTKLVNILCVGAGGGGGGGFGGTGGGGGGGASGGQTKLLIQSALIPDTLYVQSGIGGRGGSGTLPSGSGAAGTISFVALSPNTASVSNIVCASSATVAGGGVVGTINAGAGGTPPTAAGVTNAIFLSMGSFTAAVGTNGAGGGSNAAGGSVSPGIFTTGGAGGGGTSTSNTTRNGGNINTVSPYFPVISGGIGTIVVNTNGGNGADGIILYKPVLYMTGGAGGGNSRNSSNVTGRGGNGGNGAYGCGGGGGGASFGATGLGGNGGNGGDGFVIITSYF